MSHHLIGVVYIIAFLVERKSLIQKGIENGMIYVNAYLKLGSLHGTYALLNHIMPAVSNHHRFLFNKHRFNQ